MEIGCVFFGRGGTLAWSTAASWPASDILDLFVCLKKAQGAWIDWSGMIFCVRRQLAEPNKEALNNTFS